MRSFVPKEKKSACSAISSARTHARGSSIIVPTRYSISPSSAAVAIVSSRSRRSSSREADERVHDLDERRVAGPLLARRARRGRSRAPASRRSPGTSARAGSRACRASGSPRWSARIRSRICSSVASSSGGRNSCSGGSSRRIVTGRPAIASKIPSKSACWSGRSRSSARAPLLLARGHDHLAHDRQPVLGHEHVLGAAEADALRRRTRAPWPRPRACRRSRAPSGGGARRPSRGSSRSPR